MTFSSLIFGFSSKKWVNISIDSNKNTKNKTNLGLIIVYSNKGIPIKFPIKGMKKWNNPTVTAVIITVLNLACLIPYVKDKEKASILRLTAINIMLTMIYHLPTLYYYISIKNIFLLSLL